jgi:hypothetical protein
MRTQGHWRIILDGDAKQSTAVMTNSRFTQRFYTSAAYSLGAILAAWKQKTALQQPVPVQNKGA